MLILDLAIVNVAIPSIQGDLDLSQADLQCVVITYGLALGGFVLLGGRAADLFGRGGCWLEAWGSSRWPP
jgi:MFS family permease